MFCTVLVITKKIHNKDIKTLITLIWFKTWDFFFAPQKMPTDEDSEKVEMNWRLIVPLAFSIPPPWWTWEPSSTSTGSCRKPKPITSERLTWNPTTASPSPTCASCGTSWRNRACGPWAPDPPPSPCTDHTYPAATGPRARLESREVDGSSRPACGKRQRRDGLREVVASKRSAGSTDLCPPLARGFPLRLRRTRQPFRGEVSELRRTVVNARAPHRNHTLIFLLCSLFSSRSIYST